MPTLDELLRQTEQPEQQVAKPQGPSALDRLLAETSEQSTPEFQPMKAVSVRALEAQPDTYIGEELASTPITPEPVRAPAPEPKAIEPRKYTGFWNEFGSAITRGGLNVGAGLAGTAQSVKDFLDQGKFGGTFEDLSESLRDKSKKFAPAQDGPTVRKFVANAVGETLPFMAGTVAATIVGGPAAGASISFAVEGDNAYREAIESGASEEDAQIDRMIVGTVNAAIEKLQIDKIMGGGKAGGRAVKSIVDSARKKAWGKVAKQGGKLGMDALKMSITEGVEEALQEVVSTTAPALRGGEIPEGGEILKRVGMAGLGGAVAGPLLGGGGAIVSSLGQQEAGTAEVEQVTENLRQMIEEEEKAVAEPAITPETAVAPTIEPEAPTIAPAAVVEPVAAEVEEMAAEPVGFEKGEAVRAELLEKAKKVDEAAGVEITDVTPEGFGPEGKGEVEAEPDLILSTEQNKLQSEINETKTMLKGKLTEGQKTAMSRHLAETEQKLEDSYTQEQQDVIQAQKLKQDPVAPQPTAPSVEAKAVVSPEPATKPVVSGEEAVEVAEKKDEPVTPLPTAPSVEEKAVEGEKLNYTQFAKRHGYTNDYEVTDHGTLSPSGRDRISKRTQKEWDDALLKRLKSNKQGHEAYEEAIRKGEIVDPEGEITKEGLQKESTDKIIKEANTKIKVAEGQIDYIEGLGAMSHTKSGRLKIGYQRTVDDYKSQIKEAELQIAKAKKPTTTAKPEAKKQPKAVKPAPKKPTPKPKKAVKEAAKEPVPKAKPIKEANTQKEVKESAKKLTGLTSARQADIEDNLQAMGLDGPASKERKGWQQNLDNAREQGIPAKAQRLADEINTKARALSDDETAGVVIRATELKNEYSGLMDKLNKTDDPADIATLSAEANRIEQEFEHLSKAIHRSGTEKGRALAAQKLTLNRNYDLITVKTRAKAAKGKELSQKESKQFKQLSDKLNEATTKIDSLQKQMDEMQAQNFVKEGGVKRYSRMSSTQRKTRIKSLTGNVKRLLAEGC